VEKKIREVLNGVGPARALMVANKLGLFDRLYERPQRTEQLARTLRLNARGLERLLNALVALGFLQKKEKTYSLSTGMADTLTRQGANSLTRWIDLSEDLWSAWNQLEGWVRTGHPAFSIMELVHKNPRKLEDFIHGMHPRALAAAKFLMDRVDFGRFGLMLDLGGGPGTYTLELAKNFPRLRGVIFDIPPVIRITREYIRRYGLENRVEARAKDVLRSPLGTGYDVVVLANLVQMYDPKDSKRLIKKVYAALAPGGRIILHGFAKNEEGTGPAEAALFSLQIGLITPGGDAHFLSEQTDWISAAGFKDLEVFQIDVVPSTVIVGTKH
jgi:SAM-dependent methyltransferase